MKKSMQKKGFGLLEVLLAGVIIIMMMGALVVVARAAIQNSLYLQQRSQATFLAQEKMEMVRQIRDTHYIDGNFSGTRITNWNYWTWVSSPTPAHWTTVVADGATNYQLTNLCNRLRIDLFENCFLTTNPATPKTDVVDGISYTTNVTFLEINPTALGNGLLSQPPIVNVPASDVAYMVTVTTSWNGKNVQIKEVITNSRQGF